ncbi:MAG: class I SAM-dependent methyltransferase [Prevotellaceae bacterium]|jgi:2-polyprenyl-3-methyl-5-hydroxy-6-metoxy-1,4-benzoquinol methylase|nr:class I SAM-dependent methyltransferase [Prevotellaceae bacterium]
MQQRHTDRKSYFNELSFTCEHYFLPYIEQFTPTANCRVLEIGCGEGGNLAPFARRGCTVTGIDISQNRINEARRFFEEEKLVGTFLARDIFTVPCTGCQIAGIEKPFHIIIVHDVIEHIPNKYKLMESIHRFLDDDGVLFVSFPAWQMPFGGHQQICRNPIVAHLPYIHLLPITLYHGLLKIAGESPERISELLDICYCRTTIERFEMLIQATHYRLVHKLFWVINPHYEQKFGWRPRQMWKSIGNIKHLRNYGCTSCFYLLKEQKSKKTPYK